MTAKETPFPQRKPKGIRARGRASWEVRYRGPRTDGRWGDCRQTVRGSLKDALDFKKEKDLEAKIHKRGIRLMLRPAVSKARVSEYLFDPLERHWRDIAQIKGRRGKRITSDSILNRSCRAREKAGVERDYVPGSWERRLVAASSSPLTLALSRGEREDRVGNRMSI
jgi:hypothetical protein